MSNNILLYVHYNKRSFFYKHVIYTLESNKKLFNTIIFISNSILSDSQKEEISPLCNKIIERNNTGFDFGGWKVAIDELGWDNIETYDSLTIMNDSCFGPFFNLTNLLFKKNLFDFFAVEKKVSNSRLNRLLQLNKKKYLISSFIFFKKEILQSNLFRKFWSTINEFNTYKKINNYYKIKLFNVLKKAGFRNYDLFGNDSKIENISLNPYFMLKKKVPFINISDFTYFYSPDTLKKIIEHKTNYPIDLLYDYFNKALLPNESMIYINKTLIQFKKKYISPTILKIAVHIHVFYLNIFFKIISEFNKTGMLFDLFITTHSNELKEKIILHSTKNQYTITSIDVFENHGRDILPWLKIQNKINCYDIVGHFHTKKSKDTEEFIGKSWLNNIIRDLILPVKDIINTFQDNNTIGVIIPDLPKYFRSFKNDNTWGMNKKKCQCIWKKISDTEIDFSKLSTPIMPYGTMFWYRPKALTPLFNLKLDNDAFEKEPLPLDGTFAHSIERLPVYIAWDQGYDFKISSNLKTINSAIFYKDFYFHS